MNWIILIITLVAEFAFFYTMLSIMNKIERYNVFLTCAFFVAVLASIAIFCNSVFIINEITGILSAIIAIIANLIIFVIPVVLKIKDNNEKEVTA